MSEMNRRDAFKALAAVAAASGLTVTPVTAQEAHGVELVLLKCKRPVTDSGMVNIRDSWKAAVKGTSLENAKTLVIEDSLDVELVRAR